MMTKTIFTPVQRSSFWATPVYFSGEAGIADVSDS